MTTPAISISGLMSGLDTATIVQQLMYLERKPVRDLQARITLAESQRTAYQNVNTRLLALKEAAEAISGSALSESRSAVSSAEDAITASALPSTPEGTYTFRVNRLAQTSQVASGDVGAGFTFAAAGTIDIEIDGVFVGSAAVAAGDTLQDAADAINALGIDVTASVLDEGSGGTPFHLVITSGTSGAAGQLTVTENTNLPAFFDVTDGQDAEIEFGADNPITITSSTNTFADIIPGLTITVYRETEGPGAPPRPTPPELVTVTVGPAETSTDIAEKVEAFVEAYNAAMGVIDGLYLYDAEAERSALLQSDTTLRFIREDLSRFIVDPVAGLPDELNMLFQLGITLDADGALQIDSDVLNAKLASDPQGVMDLFADAADGISTRFSDRLDYVTKSYDGQITQAIDRLDTQIRAFEDQAERLNALLDLREERLRDEFMRMEEALAALQSQSSFFLQQLQGTGGGGGGLLSLLG